MKAWASKYGPDGLVVVGVHTPEFAFEHVVSNVRANARRLGVRYPVAIDNDYGTWKRGETVLARGLPDRPERARARVAFGEGAYGTTENAIRTLLAPGRALPAVSHIADPTTTGLLTPRPTSAGARLDRYTGSTIVLRAGRTTTGLPAHLAQALACLRRNLDSRLRSASSPARAPGSDWPTPPATSTSFSAGAALVHVLVDGAPAGVLHVDGDRLYTAAHRRALGSHLLELRLGPGLQAYSFTFG